MNRYISLHQHCLTKLWMHTRNDVFLKLVTHTVDKQTALLRSANIRDKQRFFAANASP